MSLLCPYEKYLNLKLQSQHYICNNKSLKNIMSRCPKMRIPRLKFGKNTVPIAHSLTKIFKQSMHFSNAAILIVASDLPLQPMKIGV